MKSKVLGLLTERNNINNKTAASLKQTSKKIVVNMNYRKKHPRLRSKYAKALYTNIYTNTSNIKFFRGELKFGDLLIVQDLQIPNYNNSNNNNNDQSKIGIVDINDNDELVLKVAKELGDIQISNHLKNMIDKKYKNENIKYYSIHLRRIPTSWKK